MSRAGARAAAHRAALAAVTALAASGPAGAQVAAEAPRYDGVRLEALELRADGAPVASDGRDASASLAGVEASDSPRPLLVLPADTTAAPPDDWLGRDKALHAGGSFLLTLSGQYVLVEKAGLSNGRALPLSAATALALGLVKEVADSRRARHPLFSWRDLAADAAGVALAAAVAAW